MKKFKKLLAVLLTLMMVLGMSATALAEEPAATDDNIKKEATITVANAVGATVYYLQVIEPDEASATGWKFSTPDIAEDYKSAFGITDDQTAIAMLIRNVITNAAGLPDLAPSIIKTTDGATSEQIQQALDNVINSETFTNTFAESATDNTKQVVTVAEAGVYAIKAVDPAASTEGAEVSYTYKAMSAYVGFGAPAKEEGGTYNYPSLMDVDVNAKKVPTTITKTDGDADDLTQIGDEVTYTITTKFPYFNQNHTNKYFAIEDNLTGATYVDDSFTVTIGTTTVTLVKEGNDANFTVNSANNSFTINLSSYIDNVNTHADQDVTITYQAEVAAVEVKNIVTSHIAGNEIDSDPVNLYTGNITLTKIEEKTDEEKPDIVLADAHFNLKEVLDDKGTETYADDVLSGAMTFVKRDPKTGEDPATNYYTYTEDAQDATTILITGSNGKLVVEGLDQGEVDGQYHFVEIKAPKGYSINENGVRVELKKAEGVTVVNAQISATCEIADTKLLALPATGGIGTTIFTVMGCVIMIGAAGMFFVSRRREF